MNRTARLSVPRTLSFVVVAAATLAGGWIACDSSTGSGGSTSGGGSTASAGGTPSTTSSDFAICVRGEDAGAKQKCPDMPDPGKDCPPGCEIEVV